MDEWMHGWMLHGWMILMILRLENLIKAILILIAVRP
jgi:hypothetical protein